MAKWSYNMDGDPIHPDWEHTIDGDYRPKSAEVDQDSELRINGLKTSQATLDSIRKNKLEIDHIF